MAHFSESLCEEVIKTEGKCGLSRNEMTQMARFALRAIRNENPWMRNGLRYLYLRDTQAHRLAGMLGYNGTITPDGLDTVIDHSMSGQSLTASRYSHDSIPLKGG